MAEPPRRKIDRIEALLVEIRNLLKPAPPVALPPPCRPELAERIKNLHKRGYTIERISTELRIDRSLIERVIEIVERPELPRVPTLEELREMLREYGLLRLCSDYHVETIDLSTARDPPEEFAKLRGIALTIFRSTGTFDLYLNTKEETRRITFDAIVYPQTFLIDWFRFKTIYIGNTAQAGLSVTLIAWRII